MTNNNATAPAGEVLGAEEVDPLDSIISEFSTLKTERDDLSQQLSGKTSELDTLTAISAKAADSLKQKDEEIAASQTTIADLQKQIDDLNAQLAAKAEAEQKAAEATEAPATEAPVTEAPGEQRRRRAAEVAPAEPTQAAPVPATDYEAELKAKDETIASLNDQLAQANAKLEAQQKDLDAAKATQEAQQKELDELHKQIDALTKSVQTDIQQDEQGRDGAPVLGTVAAASAVSSGIQKRSAEDQLEDANKRIAELEQELSSLKAAAPAVVETSPAPAEAARRTGQCWIGCAGHTGRCRHRRRRGSDQHRQYRRIAGATASQRG